MEKQNKYDILFSELKNEIIYNQHKKRQTLDNLKTTLPFNHSTLKKKKPYTPFFISLASIVVATCLVILFINDQPSNIGNQPNETSNPELNENPPLTENHTIFDVENFGNENLQLKNDILLFLDTLYLGDYTSSEVFDTAKIDAKGVAIINFTDLFVVAYNNSMGAVGAGEFLRAVNKYVFSNNEVHTLHYLLDGDASAWNGWLQYVDEPVTREKYEKYWYAPSFEDIFSFKEEKYYFYGVTINDSKATIIETLGTNYTEEKDLEIGGEGNFDRLIYEQFDLTLLFIEDHLVSAFIAIHNTQEFDRYFDSFTGNKLSHIVSEKQKSEDNIRILYSEKSLHVVTAKYDTSENLSLALDTATPESISNLNKGILD